VSWEQRITLKVSLEQGFCALAVNIFGIDPQHFFFSQRFSFEKFPLAYLDAGG
jgi:hypothetical protein